MNIIGKSALFLFLCSGTLSAQVIFDFKVDPRLDAGSQGYEKIEGCIRQEVRENPPCLFLESENGKTLSLQTSIGTIGKETERIVFRLRIRTDGRDPKAVIRWQWDREYSVSVPLKNDGEIHTYQARIPAKRPKNCLSWNTRFFPCVTQDRKAASVELYEMRFERNDISEFKRFKDLSLRRFTAMDDLLAALRKHGITAKGLEEEAAALKRKREDLGKDPVGDLKQRLSEFNDLDRNYRKTYEKLSVCRRILEQQEEAGDMRRTANSPKGLIFQHTLDQARKALAQGDYRMAKRLSEELDRNRIAAWNEILKTNPWQSGLDRNSFGRFGWYERGVGLLSHTQGTTYLQIPVFQYGSKNNPMVIVKPGRGKRSGPNICKEISWVSQEYESVYREGKTSWFWNIRSSLTAPGALFRSDAPSIRIQTKMDQIGAPQRLAGIFGGKARIFTRTQWESIPWNQLSENWLLLLNSGKIPDFPVLLTLQKRPDRMEWKAEELIFHYSKGMGTLGVAFLYGIAHQDSGFRELPDRVVQQARRINGIMLRYPWKCREDFRIDREKGFVEIRNTYTHLAVKNDWNHPGKEIAPIPPIAAFAADNGYPLQSSTPLHDTGIITKYGPYRAADGRTATYRLEIPDLRNNLLLDAPGHPEEHGEIDNVTQNFFFPKTIGRKPETQGCLSVYGPILYAWNSMSPASREQISKRGLALYDFLQKAVDDCGNLKNDIGSHGTTERTEPRTGKSYLVYGWRKWHGNRELFADVTNFVGFKMTGFYLWMNATGSWETFRGRWNAIRRQFSVLPRRADWAIMGVDCMEDSANHQIDMGPDSWRGCVTWWKFAEGFGDRRDADYALYMTVKQILPLITPFMNKREFEMNWKNTWSWAAQIPEAGWNESGNVIGCTWTNSPHIAYNSLNGCLYSYEEDQIYRRYCMDGMKEFLSRIQENYPMWNDVSHKTRPTAKLSLNTPNLQAQIIHLYALCGERAETLTEYWRNGLGKNKPKPLNHYVSCPSLADLSAGVASYLIGRDAPVRIGWNAPAAILSGFFDPKTGISTMEFASPKEFHLDLYADRKPDRIEMNGSTLKKWEFRPDRKSIRLTACPVNGKVTVKVHHDSWQAPEETAFVPVSTKIEETPAMKLCREERNRKSADQKDFVLNGTATPISLAKQINMPFSGSLREKFFLGIRNGKGLSLPAGERKICGIPFRIDAGAIGIRGYQSADFPRRVSIPVNRTFRKLYFLHTASFDSGDGSTSLVYLIHCRGGKVFRFPILSGRGIGDWWTPRQLPDAKMSSAVRSGDHPVGLYVVEWNNQHDRSEAGAIAAEQLNYHFIERIEILSGENRGVCALLAVTGEEPL